MDSSDRSSLLGPYRVVDLASGDSWLLGRLLADLGADVVLVEPPGGHPGRFTGLTHLAYNRGKRSVVIDVNDPAGHAQLLDLIAEADVLIESFGPGGLEAQGLAPEKLFARQPGLVITSLSPFGLDGPYHNVATTDLVTHAMSGSVWMTGDPDRPPVRISVPQAERVAALEGLVHTTTALFHAARSGDGQHVDVAQLPALCRTMLNAAEFMPNHGEELVRSGSRPLGMAYYAQLVYACRDGHVIVHTGLSPAGGSTSEWCRATAIVDGAPIPDVMIGVDLCDPWEWDRLVAEGRGDEFIAALEDVIAGVMATRTKAEIYEAAHAENLMIVPISNAADLHAHPQLEARGFWEPVEEQDGRVLHHPGAFAKLTSSPLRVLPRAPTVGEHTSVIVGEKRRPAAFRSMDPPGMPLEGVKVWDFTWVGVGSLSTKFLADYGATVVKNESATRPDLLRMQPPFAGAKPGPNRSMFFGDFNTSKLSLGIDAKNPLAREVLRRGVKWADVVTENFTPGTMARLGLGFEKLREINPGIIMLSTCMMGQTGPHAQAAGFGHLASALCGFYEITGWPDRFPTQYGAYTDFMAPRFCASAIVASLDHRRRTGEGQHIDVSQFEATLHLLAPELLDYELNGRIATRRGNRDPHMAPHGIFPCRPMGDGLQGERWVAIACQDDDAWNRLIEIIDVPEWRMDAQLATLAGRKEAEDDIERRMMMWTAGQDRTEVVIRLRAAGIAAGPVSSPSETHDDPQLGHLNFYQTLVHPVMGSQSHQGLSARMSRTPGRLSRPSPCLGEDAVEVLSELLGFSEDEIGELIAAEAVEVITN